MHTVAEPRILRIGTRDLAMGGADLGELADATADLADPAALRRRLADDGYLLLRGAQDREQVLAARREMVASLRAEGVAAADGGPLDCVPASGSSWRPGVEGRLADGPAFRAVVESERIRRLMSVLQGGDVLTFSHKWVRVVAPGQFTGAHYDIVYMGRGSPGLLTVWTPFGDVPAETGALAVVPGSHRAPGYQRVRDTYGRMDVDRDRVGGHFADDPLDVTGRYGGRWATTDFRAGDVLIFGMHLMHMSLANASAGFRLTADTRWQRNGEAVDERWVGPAPKGHYAWFSDPAAMVPMSDQRRAWGV